MARDVLYGDGILNGEAMALALYPSLVNQDATIGRQTCDQWSGMIADGSVLGQTSKCKADVVVQHDRLAHSARILQLQNGLLFYTKDHDVLAADAHLNATC